MNASASARLAIGRRLSQAILLGSSAPESIPFVDELGRRPILLALPNDQVRAIFDRLAKHYPTGANVVTQMNGHLVTVVVRRSDNDEPFGARDGDWAIPLRTTLRTVVNVLWLAGHSIRCRPQAAGFPADFVATDAIAA